MPSNSATVKKSVDLKIIKAKYGEDMAHYCKKAFVTLLEHDGLLVDILTKYFCDCKNLLQDIIAQEKLEKFKAFVFFQSGIKIPVIKSDFSAQELLDKAGYILYPECQTEADIQSFRHYYHRQDGKTPTYNHSVPIKTDGEEICTFDGGRLNDRRVWFAVKKNVKDIRRENFEKPSRQDEYSTSVISIQFTKGSCSNLFIISRYNHDVYNPDCTFGNNLDNIIEGLSDAFERDYGVKDFLFDKAFVGLDLDGYVKDKNGKFYPYNYEINNIYYCSNNIIIDESEVITLSPAHQLLVDYYIVDTQAKTVSLYDSTIKDGFVDELYMNQKIDINKDSVKITKLDGGIALIGFNARNQIISFQDNTTMLCKDNFMIFNETIKSLNLSKVLKCGNCFLRYNKSLQEFYAPDLTRTNAYFLDSNEKMRNKVFQQVNCNMAKSKKLKKFIIRPKTNEVSPKGINDK